MADDRTVDAKCPVCGASLKTSSGSTGGRTLCHACGEKVLVPTAALTDDEDDAWLTLDDDLLPSSKSPIPSPTTPASASVKSEPPLTIPGIEVEDSQARVGWSGDAAPPPPLSEHDMLALSGFADDEDQAAAPMRRVDPPAAKPGESFRVRCPTCDSLSYAKVEQVGKRIRCSDCHSPIVVPPPPKVKPKYQPDIDAAKAYTFQEEPDIDPATSHQRVADPFRKSADEYLRKAEMEQSVEEPDDWEVPSIREWFSGLFTIFRDPNVVGHWLVLSALGGVPAAITASLESQVLVVGLMVGGWFFAAILVACGFAILQAVANGQPRVSEWPIFDPAEWFAQVMVAVSALAVAVGPAWMLGSFLFSGSLATIAVAMASLYLLFPFVLLSMLDEQSVFVPFSAQVSKSVTRMSEQWGGLYFSSGLLFAALFFIYLFCSVQGPVVGPLLSVTATVGATFLYFAMIGRLAFLIGQSVNAAPMVNDVERSPKMPD